jgi:hypothetical protein
MPTSSPGALAAVLLSAAAAAAPAAAAPFELPADPHGQWTVGVAAFRGEDLAPDDAWLAWSIPLMLRDRVAGLATHAIGPEERAAVGRATIARERLAVLASLASLRRARDEAAFGERAVPQPSPGSSTPAAKEALAEAEEHLAWLDGLDPSAVVVPDRKPIVFKEGREPGLLLAAPFGSPAEAAAREEVDLLVGGSVRESSGYFLVDVWAWDTAGGTAVFTWRDGATRSELYERAAEAGRGLAQVLLGRPWASLEVTVQPPGASVLVDGRPPGTGRSRFDDLEPGSHEIRVSAPGYREEVRSVELAAQTETSIAVDLEALDLGTITLVSDPPGADAWLDAVWQGRTPLDVPRPGDRSRLVVSLADGPEAALIIGPSSPAQLAISLSEAALRSAVDQAAARDRFYGSFGWFVLSLPVPYYTYSWALDWAAEYYRLKALPDPPTQQERDALDKDIAKARGFSYGLYYTYLAGLGVSVGLAGWTVYNIVRYVMAADRTAAPGHQP